LVSLAPGIGEDIIGIPVPFIIGAYASPAKKWELLETAEYSVIVLLDTGEIIQNEDMVVNIFPALYSSAIKDHYKPFEKNFYESLQNSVVNEPTKEQVNAAEAICKEVESIIKTTILNKLPNLQEPQDPGLALARTKSTIQSQLNDENKEFVEELIKSQMFAVYLERHYDYLT